MEPAFYVDAVAGPRARDVFDVDEGAAAAGGQGVQSVWVVRGGEIAGEDGVEVLGGDAVGRERREF